MTTAAAVQMLFPEATTEFGSVLTRSGKRARVTTPSGERTAEVAASCLVSPAPGDRVLVAHAGEEAYVLAVLQQRVEGETRLVFDQDVSINVLKGRLRILAQEGVDLVSPQALKVHVGNLAADAEQFQLAFSALNLVGQSIMSKTTKVRIVAESFDTVAGRIYQRAVNFLRRTDELDRVEAKNMDRKAEQLHHVHGQNTVTTAEHLVKIDGSQVHVG
jgi:hypothetical protein